MQIGKPIPKRRAQRRQRSGKKSGNLIGNRNPEIKQHANALEFLQQREERSERYSVGSAISTPEVKLVFEFEDASEIRSETGTGGTFPQKQCFGEYPEVTEPNVFCNSTIIERDASFSITENVKKTLSQTNNADEAIANARKAICLLQVVDSKLTEAQQSGSATNVDVGVYDEDMRLPICDSPDKDGDLGTLQKLNNSGFSNMVESEHQELRTLRDEQMQQYPQKSSGDESQQSAFSETLFSVEDVEMSSVSECAFTQSFTFWDVSTLFTEGTITI